MERLGRRKGDVVAFLLNTSPRLPSTFHRQRDFLLAARRVSLQIASLISSATATAIYVSICLEDCVRHGCNRYTFMCADFKRVFTEFG